MKRPILVLVLAALVAGCGKSEPSNAIPANDSPSPLKVAPRDDDMVRGNPNAPITLVEYASMACPHCARWDAEVLPKLMENYVNTGKVRYIFREFPTNGAARVAAALARCEKGDAFHSFIGLLYHDQRDWLADANGDGQISKEDIFATLGQEGAKAGMTHAQAEACMNDPKNLAIVDANMMEGGTRYNVSATPTFIIVGHQTFVGLWPWNELDAALKSADSAR